MSVEAGCCSRQERLFPVFGSSLPTFGRLSSIYERMISLARWSGIVAAVTIAAVTQRRPRPSPPYRCLPPLPSSTRLQGNCRCRPPRRTFGSASPPTPISIHGKPTPQPPTSSSTSKSTSLPLSTPIRSMNTPVARKPAGSSAASTTNITAHPTAPARKVTPSKTLLLLLMNKLQCPTIGPARQTRRCRSRGGRTGRNRDSAASVAVAAAAAAAAESGGFLTVEQVEESSTGEELLGRESS